MPYRSFLSFFINLEKKIFSFKEFGAFLASIIVFAFLAFYIPDKFLNLRSIESILILVTQRGILATAITFLLIAREIDLSIGSVYAFISMLFAVLIANYKVNGWLALLIALSVTIPIGFLNGILSTKLGIPSLIATIGTMMLWRGVVLGVWGAAPIAYGEDLPVLTVMGGTFLGRASFNMSFIWLLIIGVMTWVLLEHTKFGNSVFATGSNPLAAKEMGINTDRVKIMLFMLSSFTAGLSGIIQFGHLRINAPTAGEGLELEVVAATVIGGTSLLGGVGSIPGAIIGAFLVAEIMVGIILAGISSYWYRTFVGVVLLTALLFNILSRRGLSYEHATS